MPIKLPNNLPAFNVLQSEGVSVMTEAQASRQDIRPLQIALLNLMPKKIATETQFARLIGATPLQIEFTLIRMSEHQSKNTSSDHMDAFYTSFQDIKHRKFDGLVITGAPIEHLSFTDVSYWDEMTEVMNWTQTNVHSTFGVCWGGMAMINHFHNIEKHMLAAKAFGCFRHQRLDESSPYLRGFSDDMVIPVSRWTEVRQDELDAANLTTLLASDKTGPCLVQDDAHRALYVFNHFEYDRDTLKQEYDRDLESGKPINVPDNYYPKDDPTKTPQNRWRSHGHLLYGNWINEIYQSTHFDLSKIGISTD
ncbi:MAG TPA: homoserine O-succinyltransferase [Rhodobacteraceae bacterium]|nr:homoserine O-succinyltransferase [Amylibacter sp.]MDG1236378.1 homoserine O-succinyltransferase [Amylibacter sp.]HAD29000.1 homoserine O-succinyltransferase [Paracoccaceae bacterium]|tara:strand:- start:131 stop:1054 length:924 start_codon:yes stop_codon:yes gene_type:complete